MNSGDAASASVQRSSSPDNVRLNNQTNNSNVSIGTEWTEFCEKQAKTAAIDFARAFSAFVNLDLSESERAKLTHKDFLRKYIESFCDNFEAEYSRRTDNTHTESTVSTNQRNINNRVLPTRAISHEGFNHPSSEQDHEVVSTKSNKPFFRRLSFKGIKGKLFQKQQSVDDNTESRKEKPNKTKLSKILVECRKEGIVNSTIVENTDVPQRWEKSRLTLVKASAGYIIEISSCSKGSKPTHGIFCSSIIEVRETTALEMPDHENTFVIKTLEKEIVIDARDITDMKSWLATIRYCMREPHINSSGGNENIDYNMGDSTMSNCHNDGDRPRSNSTSRTFRINQENIDEHGNPPDIPPRLRNTNHLELISSQQEIEQIPPGNETPGNDVDLSSNLLEYPWFHGTLPRSDAAVLVLHKGPEGHGTFLVRQSETRKGDFVLTFNFQGKAKHLRMLLAETGHCRVQHLQFATVFDMLDHFRQNPIPLESGGPADVKLTEYVVANQDFRNNRVNVNSGPQERRPAVPQDAREVRVSSGSLTPIE